MKTVLVLAGHPGAAEAVRQALAPERFRVVHRANAEEAEPFLTHGLADLCILDAELTGVEAIWSVEKVRRRAPRCPLLVLTGAREGQWEEEAYVQGVTQVLPKPIRPRLLQAVIQRLLPPAPPPLPADAVLRPGSTDFLPPPAAHAADPGSQVLETAGRLQSFAVLRKFSGILTHSLDAEALLRQFLLMLRELFSVNRGAVFLRAPSAAPGPAPGAGEGQRLRAVTSVGLSPGLLEHFELSLEGGLGGLLLRLGRIVRCHSEEALRHPEVQKEFELLGAQVAVPLLDREQLLGAVVLDGRVTGEPLLNAELELIFQLLEQVGLALRNIWLHDQLVANHEMMANILRELSSACVLVNRDLVVLHANKAARKFFSRADSRTGELTFGDLPEPLGSKVYQVLKTGAALAPFRYEPDTPSRPVFAVSVVPFLDREAGRATAALLIAEDRTQAEQVQRLEIETANLRLLKTMAERIVHEIGNALVPLSTHQQLLADKWKDAEFRASLNAALAEGVKRVTRLVNQMRYLARDTVTVAEPVALAPLIEEAFQEAQRYQAGPAGQLRYEDPGRPLAVPGDRAALKQALVEVIINALQANPADPKIGVTLSTDSGGNGRPGLQIEVRDNGSGFTPEAARSAAQPFYTTRNVGLGLGLAVTRKIIEMHHGQLELVPTTNGQAGVVRIRLPLEAAPAPNP